jgi:hypothetical protein
MRTNAGLDRRWRRVLAFLLVCGGAAGSGACTSRSLTSTEPDCKGIPVTAVACLVGPTVNTCTSDAHGRPTWVTSCPGESSTGTAGAGGSPADAGNSVQPFTVTFDLQNGGPSSIFVYEGCSLEMTLIELADPTHLIGRVDGCGICDCSAVSCPAVSCGACFSGPLEVAAADHFTYGWTALDQTTMAQGERACVSTRILPAGHYRVDVPVYASASDAQSRTAPRTVSQSFDLPPSGDVVVSLADSP